MSKDDFYISLKETAQLLGVSYATVKTYVREKRFPAFRLKRIWFVDPVKVRQFFDNEIKKQSKI